MWTVGCIHVSQTPERKIKTAHRPPHKFTDTRSPVTPGITPGIQGPHRSSTSDWRQLYTEYFNKATNPHACAYDRWRERSVQRCGEADPIPGRFERLFAALGRAAVLCPSPIPHCQPQSTLGCDPRRLSVSRLDAKRHVLSSRTSWGDLLGMTTGCRSPVLHTHTQAQYMPVRTDPPEAVPAIYSVPG